MNLHEFSSKFQLTVPFTQYYGLLSANPQNWKTMLKNCGQEQDKQTIPVDTSTTSSIYSTLLKDVFVPPTAESKILRHRFTKKNIQKVYLLPFTITKEVKIIMFQYKVIHNILPTRSTLYRDGHAENDLCNLCNTEKQTLDHLLIHCSTSVYFWTLFQNWWYGKTHESIVLTASHILYGWHNRTKHWQVLNNALLIAKYCIFCTSLRGETLCFRDFLLQIQEKLQILKVIATAQNSLPKFYRTWEVII